LIFAAPWVLLALAALPALWWLLRVIPPAPRRQVFPAVRLLLGLGTNAQTAARTPLWLLALRLLTAALVVVGLARPVLGTAAALPGHGPLLLVIDDGWAAAADWAARLRAADSVLARADRAGRSVALLATASLDFPSLDTPAAMPASELRPRAAVLRPKPWMPDRAAAAAAIRVWSAAHPGGGAAFIGDGLTDGAAWPEFAAALAATGPVRVLDSATPPLLLLAPLATPDGFTVRVAQPPGPLPTSAAVLGASGDGRILARVPLTIPAGQAVGEAPFRLPSELRNRLTRLSIEGPQGALASAGAVVLLDEGFRRRPVGIVRGDAADTPLSGGAYYVRRALAPYAELREGDVATLLARPLSVLALIDQPLPPGPQAEQLRKWIAAGGLLLRFAGPQMAEAAAQAAAGEADLTDPLLPVPLLAADRQLGGAMSWSQAEKLAPVAPGSPFAGIQFPDEIRVQRQVLGDPAADLPGTAWARLADGTPLVTQRAIGAGRVVLFHVTANADWSSLPLSGAFVTMLRRLVALSAGVAAGNEASDAMLAPAETLDGEGLAVPPPATATAIAARNFAATAVSAQHPPGLYGPEASRRALNLSANLALPVAAPAIQGASVEALDSNVPERPVGPFLVALALALLAMDLLLSLRLRGLLQAAAVVALLLLAGGGARAEATNPALETRLAYVVTGDPQVDEVARSGLAGLSAYVNSRTAAVLAEPAAVTPGVDDLSFYPLLYWPLSADAPDPSPAMLAAMNGYTAHGGIILIDTRDGGSGAGMAPGTDAILRRIAGAGGLIVPPLAPLTSAHVLARSFYLLRDFPGRYDGGTVWVGRDQDRSNDSVSPVIVGGDDWAAAWAVDATDHHPFATLPGGQRQRVLAYRFGVNLVMYALTGNYKGDQVHVPALLQRLGQ